MGNEINDNEDIGFDEALADRRHKEMTGMLKQLTISLNKAPDKSTAQAIEKLVTKLSDLKFPEIKLPDVRPPDINVEFDHAEIVKELKRICDEICESNQKVIEALEKKKLVSEFKVKRGYGGEITSMEVVYKSDLGFSKIKAQA